MPPGSGQEVDVMFRKQMLMVLLVFVAALSVAGCANPADGTAEAEVRDADPAASAPVESMEGAVFVITDASTIGFVGSNHSGRSGTAAPGCGITTRVTSTNPM